MEEPALSIGCEFHPKDFSVPLGTVIAFKLLSEKNNYNFNAIGV
jgi:hypothetical protein